MNFSTFRWELEKTLILVADKVFQRSLKVYLSGGHFVGISARKHGDILLQLNISTYKIRTGYTRQIEWFQYNTSVKLLILLSHACLSCIKPLWSNVEAVNLTHTLEARRGQQILYCILRTDAGGLRPRTGQGKLKRSGIKAKMSHPSRIGWPYYSLVVAERWCVESENRHVVSLLVASPDQRLPCRLILNEWLNYKNAADQIWHLSSQLDLWSKISVIKWGIRSLQKLLLIDAKYIPSCNFSSLFYIYLHIYWFNKWK